MSSMSYGPTFFKSCLDDGNVHGISTAATEIASQRWQAALDGAANASRRIPILEHLDPPQTTLLVVDMQRGFLDAGAAVEVPAGRDIIANINKLAVEFRKQGARVIFCRYLVDQRAGLLGLFERRSYLGSGRESPLEAFKRGHPQFDLYPELDVQPSDIIIDKIRYSAVLGSDIVAQLRAFQVQNVVVTGVTTDVCAGNTAEDLMQMDFHVVMVWDGTAALDRLE